MRGSFFAELKRRNVYKVAVAYAVVGWVIAQIATQIFPFLEIPNWVVRLVIVLIAIGFPIALVIAWAFEATPEGIKRTEDADALLATNVGVAATTKQPKKRAWIYVVVIGAAISVGLFFVGRYSARTNAHLWAEIYDRKLTDIFAVESDIAKTIADTLQAKLTGSEKTAISKEPTANTEAYELYHKGRSLWGKRTGDNIPKAIAFYEQAIARDPNYALAYAGLSTAYILAPFYTGADRREAGSKAKEAALKALRLDPNLAEAHAALGKVLFFSEIDLAGATREYKRAIELKPNDADAHHWFSNDSLAALGQFDEAIAAGKRSVDLDPLSIVINADLGETLFYARRFDESVAQLRKTLEIDPTSFYAHYNLGIALQAKGDLSGAIAEYEKAKQLSDNPAVATFWAQAKAHTGDKDAARRMLSELDQISQHREVPSYLRALLYLSLNNKDEALRWLEQGYEERDGSNICWINVDPLLDPLRGDPRFEALVKKVIAPKTDEAR